MPEEHGGLVAAMALQVGIICMYIHTYINIYIYVHIYIHIHTCINIYTCVHIYIHIHTLTYRLIRRGTYTCAYAHNHLTHSLTYGYKTCVTINRSIWHRHSIYVFIFIYIYIDLCDD